MKDLRPKELYKFFIMKKYIRKFVRLNTKTSEEDRYVKKKKDPLSLPEGFKWKNRKS